MGWGTDPVVEDQMGLPEDPLKRKTALVDLALKYKQLGDAGKKENKPKPTYAEVAAGEAAKTEGREVGKFRAAARQGLPSAVGAAKANSAKIQQLLTHPGFSALVGAPNPFKGGLGVYTVPGSRARGAESLFKQIKGTAFLAGIQQMKGSGPVSEREGLAAEAAIQRMSTALSEEEFQQAAQEYVDAMERGINAMRNVATMPGSTAVAQPGASGEEK